MKPLRQKILIASLLIATFGAGFALHDRLGWHQANASTVASPPVPMTPLREGINLPDFTSIVSAQGPAVVNISVSGTTKTSAQTQPDLEDDSALSDFLKRFGAPGSALPHNIPMHGLGSGFIVDAGGVILTNAHVVEQADEVTVKLNDKREFKAKVVGIDKLSDVAVLRIPAQGLPTVKIGDPQKARVGEWVVAIGSPFGFENTVTAGIISAKSRTLPDDGFVPFMQTDVAINPGNSGGPLFNVNGEVVGINSQIYSRSGGYQGLSFAIPIDVAMNVEHQLVTKGKVSRGRLGVSIQEMDQGLADTFGLDKPHGALVTSVERNSPAAKAGIEAGDIILSFNGHDIGRSSELPSVVASTAPGVTSRLSVWHQGHVKELTLITGELSDMASTAAVAPQAIPTSGKLGLSVRPLTHDEQREVSGGQGLVVQEVMNGPAARAGIRAGDVIVSANGSVIRTPEQLKTQVDHAGKIVALLIERDGMRIFVPITIG